LGKLASFAKYLIIIVTAAVVVTIKSIIILVGINNKLETKSTEYSILIIIKF